MSTVTKYQNCRPEVWGGIECTINRVGDEYRDQLQLVDHYRRKNDLEQFAALGISKIRYPVLWEHHQPSPGIPIDFNWTADQLETLRSLNVTPIAGLVHHGSGPLFTDLTDENFAPRLAAYAGEVASRFPWIENYTPVNEPLTTARFSGLYGIWYPHQKNELAFFQMFFNQLKAVVLAMQAIRSVNPRAQLIQTEDLGKTHSTHLLKYQASFENERRWLTNDVLCGKLNEDHFFWNYLLQLGLAPSTLEFFLKNPTPPSVIGFNYYVTSERWLDHRVANYPVALHGGNGRHTYVDIEAVRAGKPLGLPVLLREAWNRYKLPLAITECHLNCTREEQMRWLGEVWDQSCKLARSGIDIKAVTAWSLLGAYDWNSLLTQKNNHYEPGVFDVSTGKPRITALGKMIRSYSSSASFDHPLLQQKGWWHTKDANPLHNKSYIDNTKPLLIIGNTGTLGYAFTMVCKQRSIPFTSLGRKDINICDARSIEEVIEAFQPWAIVNATGYVRVDDAETDAENCFAVNATAPSLLARACFERGVRFMTFSSDLVFDGLKLSPYDETDEAIPLNVYGKSKAEGEKMTLLNNPEALIIRTSAFFGPWDQYNFAYNVLKAIKTKSPMALPDDITVSPTYIPDLCHTAMDLFIDGETAIWHLANEGVVTWSGFGDIIAARSGCKNHRLTAKPSNEMGWRAKRPFYSVLQSGKGVRLPKLELAVERFFEQQTF